jgi:hypothetical protein
MIYNFHDLTFFKFYLDFEIGIWNQKGTILDFWYFQNYFKFYTETLKTQNIKVVHLDKTYNFAFWFTLKLFLDFELHKKG